MNVIWTEGAIEDLAAIVEFIKRDSPDSAMRVATHIFAKADSLSTMPRRGRHRLPEDAWELILAPWRYVIVYEILEDSVSISGVRHTSQASRPRD